MEGVGDSKSGLMIVGEFPTYYDYQNEKVMASAKYLLLKKVFDKALEDPWDNYYRTYLVQEVCGKDTPPTPEQIEEGKAQLIDQINRLKPKVILAVGGTVLQALTGRTGILKQRGKILNLEIGETSCKIVPILSPRYVEVNDKHIKNFAYDVEKAVNLSKGFEFTSKASTNTVLVDTVAKVEELITYIKQTGTASFDTETTGLNTREAGFRATMLSFTFQHGSAWVIPLFHDETPFSRDEILYILKLLQREVFANPNIEKIAQNMKYDMHVLAVYGVTIWAGEMHDTMLMHHLLDETQSHGLKDLVSTFFKQYAGYEAELGEKPDWASLSINTLVPYAGMDTDMTLRLKTLFESYLLEDEQLYCIYRNLTMAANKVLWQAEHEGMLIDKEKLLRYIGEAEDILEAQDEALRDNGTVHRFQRKVTLRKKKEKLKELDEKIGKCKPLKSGGQSVREVKYRELRNRIKIEGMETEPVNFGSPVQLGDLLYTDDGFGYKMPYDKKTRGPKPLTGKDFIAELEDSTGFIEGLQVWRSIKKMLSTYLMGIYNRLDDFDRIHTSFLLHGTESGRLSSRNPNLQNIPNLSKVKNPLAVKVVKMVKDVFKCPDDHFIVQYDYSQAELRIIADFANEKTMIEAYRNDEDIHAKTGAKFAGVSLENLYKMEPLEIKTHRTNAKAGNFGLIYLMAPEGLVEYAKSNYGLILTLAQATRMWNDFFELYPRLLVHHDKYINLARRDGYVRTLYGRKRRTPDIKNENEYIRAMDERVAVNSPIQGTAGEFTIFAIALLGLRLDPRVKLVNTVHDSIIFYIPKDIFDDTMILIKETMENLPNEDYFGTELKHLKMKVDAEISPNSWGDLKDFDLKKYLN